MYTRGRGRSTISFYYFTWSIKYKTASGICAFVDIAYAQKDISPAIFEKLSGLPKGFIENIADDSRFMEDDMGVPDLISLRNSNKHSEFINCYVGPYHG